MDFIKQPLNCCKMMKMQLILIMLTIKKDPVFKKMNENIIKFDSLTRGHQF